RPPQEQDRQHETNPTIAPNSGERAASSKRTQRSRRRADTLAPDKRPHRLRKTNPTQRRNMQAYGDLRRGHQPSRNTLEPVRPRVKTGRSASLGQAVHPITERTHWHPAKANG